MGAGCGKSVKDVDAGGSNFSNVAGKKEAPIRNMATIKIVSMKKAIARSQNPAKPGRGGRTGISGIAGIISGGCAFCGT
jgi:hypothetical protein